MRRGYFTVPDHILDEINESKITRRSIDEILHGTNYTPSDVRATLKRKEEMRQKSQQDHADDLLDYLNKE